MALPNWLSCFPEKLECYSIDPHFREGWTTLTDLRRRGILSSRKLWALGSVLLKADAVLRGNGLQGLRLLEANGFALRAVRAVSFSNERVEQLWRYSLGRLSPERVALLKRLQTTAPSLYVLVESVESVSRLPCSLQLTELKGQVEITRRRAGTLRYAMGEPQSAFFNFVHTADEPADLVRELGLLFDSVERQDVLLESTMGTRPNAESTYELLRRGAPHSDLDHAHAMARLRSRVVSMNALSDADRAGFLEAADRLQDEGQHERYSAWLSLRNRLRGQGLEIDEIDDIVITGRLIVLKQARPTQPFPSCEARHWDDHHPWLGSGT